jgi:hypothetical protein
MVKIIERHYNLNSTSEKKRVPSQIMAKNKWHKLAGLAAFIVDEGHVGDSIDIYASNENLLGDLHQICEELDYKWSYVVLKAKAGIRTHKLDHFRLRVSLNVVEKLQRDLNELTKIFPTCGLSQKQEPLELIIRRRALKRGKGQNGIAKAQIIERLRKGPTSVKCLREEMLIGGQTICEHLNQLESENKIEKHGKIKNSVIWGLTKNQIVSSGEGFGSEKNNAITGA